MTPPAEFRADPDEVRTPRAALGLAADEGAVPEVPPLLKYCTTLSERVILPQITTAWMASGFIGLADG